MPRRMLKWGVSTLVAARIDEGLVALDGWLVVGQSVPAQCQRINITVNIRKSLVKAVAETAPRPCTVSTVVFICKILN